MIQRLCIQDGWFHWKVNFFRLGDLAFGRSLLRYHGKMVVVPFTKLTNPDDPCMEYFSHLP